MFTYIGFAADAPRLDLGTIMYIQAILSDAD
jgi:hypothetical protein